MILPGTTHVQLIISNMNNNESEYKYNSWPLGKLKPEEQRLEPAQIKARGYNWNDPRDIVDMFEKKVADFWGSEYAVAVDCCSHAIFLSLKYLLHIGQIKPKEKIIVPNHTYVSVPMQVIHAGLAVRFSDFVWRGWYCLGNTSVIDAAVYWQKDGYIKDSLMCLSFQIKKFLPIGRGGIILTDSKDAYEWLKRASYDSRDLKTPYDSENHVSGIGWHYYLSPEDAARGILLMDLKPESIGAYMDSTNYPDTEKMMKGIK